MSTRKRCEDWGMRAIKSVLVVAGGFKRALVVMNWDGPTGMLGIASTKYYTLHGEAEGFDCVKDLVSTTTLASRPS